MPTRSGRLLKAVFKRLINDVTISEITKFDFKPSLLLGQKIVVTVVAFLASMRRYLQRAVSDVRGEEDS